ncbi:SPFH domain-containing protein [Lacunimicrobium album]|jgi:membrane protease subunit (stomatin/prohibitin family)
MGFFDKLRAELVDIIEWIDDSKHTLVWRFPRYNNQIKNGAQLIVRPGQKAIFVHRGQIADIFEEGHYTLKTDNLPILSTIMGWKYGFDSPFKAEVYFVSTRQITDLKWGTPNPVMLRDPEFGPIRLRAFGTYALKAVDPKALLKELVGTNEDFSTEEVAELMRSIINTALADILGKSQTAALDLAGKYQEFSAKLRDEVATRIDDEYGLEIPQLFIVNISLPEEVEKALDTRSSMGVIGDMNRFQSYQMGKAMTDAAANPGGGAAEGLGMGMGFAMANRMAGGMMAPGAAAPMAPPPVPASVFHVAVNGASQGPYTLDAMRQAVASGQIQGDTLVWSPSLTGWTPASQVPAVAALMTGSAPPPLP